MHSISDRIVRLVPTLITSVILPMNTNHMDMFTTINVRRSTKEKLEKRGKFGQSFDELINDLLETTGSK